jgi:hypothetical protein
MKYQEDYSSSSSSSESSHDSIKQNLLESLSEQMIQLQDIKIKGNKEELYQGCKEMCKMVAEYFCIADIDNLQTEDAWRSSEEEKLRKLFGALNRKSIPELYKILQTHQEEVILDPVFIKLFGYIEELYKEELEEEQTRLRIERRLDRVLLADASFSNLVRQSNCGLIQS